MRVDGIVVVFWCIVSINPIFQGYLTGGEFNNEIDHLCFVDTGMKHATRYSLFKTFGFVYHLCGTRIFIPILVQFNSMISSVNGIPVRRILD